MSNRAPSKLSRGIRLLERHAARRRAGLTLVEIVVVVAILLVLAAAIMPSMVSQVARERVAAAVDALENFVDAMTEMRKDNQDWPARLSHMSEPITTSDSNICYTTYSPGKVSNWGGPYLDRVVPPTGLDIGIGTIQDLMYRSNISGNDALLTMQINSVSAEDALALNQSVDNDGDVAGRTTGTVQWSTTTSEGLVTVFFYRPIRGC